MVMKYKSIIICMLLLLPQTAALLAAETGATKKSMELKAVAAPKGKVSSANVFNRLLKKEKERNAPPPEDGIHDPANEGTQVLQPPRIAYEGLPKSDFGNYVDWVQALQKGYLNPRYDRVDPTVEPLVMDLDIVREVKASMPDVVFPHKPHTQWLHCSNCHPKIFIPQKGANQINMSAILLGQKCGVCHGKVSFPITTKSCKKCHSKPKPKDWKPPLSQASVKNPWR
jgi:c(7)-type cytochrome triheme protein